MDQSEDLFHLALKEKKLKLQQTIRQNSKLVKLKRSSLLYFFNLVALFILQVIAIYFFKQGFLLTRQVLPNTSSSSDLHQLLIAVPEESFNYSNYHYDKIHTRLFEQELISSCWAAPSYSKAVVVIIDALRFDFVVPIDQSDLQYNKNFHNNFPVLFETYQQNDNNSVLMKFLADPPTTTLQRLKGLTTGSLPTFIDAGSNFDGDEIDEDNLVSQLFYNNKKVSQIGDDTWINLFEKYLNMNLSWPYESLNVWDIDTVDNGVLEHLYPLLKRPDNWDVIVGHMLGVDHVGHRYGPDNLEMVGKLAQMNREIARLIETIDDDTLLVVMGDHGMDATGNHGGDSQLELESTLFMYGRKGTFQGNRMKLDYKLAEIDAHFPAVNQIDFVPSFGLLLGVPIPYGNLGRPINQVHGNSIIELLKVNYVNILNLQRYKLTLIKETNEHALKDLEMFDRFNRIVVEFNEINSTVSEENLNRLLDTMIDYQNDSLEIFKNIWAKFNNTFIYIGIGLLAMSLVILVLLAKIIPAIVFNQLITEFLTIIILMIFFWVIVLNAAFVVLKPAMFSVLSINLLAVSIGIISGFLIIIFDRYNIHWLLKQFKLFVNDFDSPWSFISISLLVGMFLSYSSNSFIIFQDSIINFFLINYGLYNLLIFARRLYTANSMENYYGLVHSCSFIVIQKLNSFIRTCREEQSNHCPKMITNTGGLSNCKSSNEFTLVSIGLLILVSLLFPKILQHFLDLNLVNSYQSSAKLWIGNLLKVILAFNVIYWCLDYIEFNQEFNAKYFNLSFAFMKSAKLVISRVIMGVCLLVGNFAWSKGPLCIKIILKDNVTDVIGINNIYGSSFLLLILNFFGAILITNKPYSSISLILLMYQLLNTIELVSILNLRNNMIAPIIFNLLGYSFFYSTDHQITINSIKWELGFQLADTIIFPLSHLPIFLNSFGPFILVSLSVVLISVWKIPPNMKPISLLLKIVVTCLTLLMSQTIITLSSLIFTNHFKRHLMVWKIFVPSFLFNSLILIVINLVVIFISFFFGITKLIHQVNRLQVLY